MRDPVLCDGRPVAEPHALVTLDVLEQPRQRSNPAGATDDPTVQADTHHARSPLLSHAIEPVEGIPAVCEELFPGAEMPGALQAAVVGVEAIGNDERSAALGYRPGGKTIIRGRGV